MITASLKARHSPPWRRELAEAVRDPAELLRRLGLQDSPLASQIDRDGPFRTLVPASYLQRMRYGDAGDPLLLQVLARGQERLSPPGYDTDPVGDLQALIRPGLMHKYAGRALLMPTGACAVHCRYCFRRHFPYAQAAAGRQDWSDLAARLRRDPALREVILSGGDPLTLSDQHLRDLLKALRGIPQLARLRIHTRLPIVLPSRIIESSLVKLLEDLPWPCTLVVHANHAREIDAQVAAGISALRAGGLHVLNQSVLLKDINDAVDALCDLSEALFAAGALPYYLHQLDPVSGAAHFAVSEERARRLLLEVRNRLPGYLVPRLVKELPGAPAKISVA
jgi:EF-P beta-lysylation protein EpmB